MKDILRRPTWYRMTQVFDGLAKKIADVGEHGVILRGVRYEAAIKCGECGHTIHLHNLRVGASGDKLDLSPEIGICVVPMGIPDSMGESLRMLCESNLRMPIVLMTANVHYVQLRSMHAEEAKELMREAPPPADAAPPPAPGLILPFERKADEPERGDA